MFYAYVDSGQSKSTEVEVASANSDGPTSAEVNSHSCNLARAGDRAVSNLPRRYCVPVTSLSTRRVGTRTRGFPISAEEYRHLRTEAN